MEEKDYTEFLEKEALNWTVQYKDTIYIMDLSKVKKRYVFKILVIPQNQISFKKKRLEVHDEYVEQGKDIASVKRKMQQKKIFDHHTFADVYQDIVIIDKGS